MRRTLKAVLRALKTALLLLKTMPLAFAKWIGGIAKWIGGIAGVVGVLFVGLQYLDARWKSRIERSLNLVLTYQDETKVKARNEIDLSYNAMAMINDGYQCKAYNKDKANNIEVLSKIDLNRDSNVCQIDRCRAAIL